jgi:glutathione S-transferase
LLIHGHASLQCRVARVWLALEHKQIPYEMKTVSFSGGDLTKPEFHAINPRHKVPAIVDDGFALYESTAIMEYLEDKYSTGAALLPANVQDRARARRIMQESDWYLNTALRPLLEEIFFKAKENWDSARIERAAKDVNEELKVWE